MQKVFVVLFFIVCLIGFLFDSNQANIEPGRVAVKAEEKLTADQLAGFRSRWQVLQNQDITWDTKKYLTVFNHSFEWFACDRILQETIRVKNPVTVHDIRDTGSFIFCKMSVLPDIDLATLNVTDSGIFSYLLDGNDKLSTLEADWATTVLLSSLQPVSQQALKNLQKNVQKDFESWIAQHFNLSRTVVVEEVIYDQKKVINDRLNKLEPNAVAKGLSSYSELKNQNAISIVVDESLEK